MTNARFVVDRCRRTSLPSNPFATRYTRPGMLAPRTVDGGGLDLGALIARMRTEPALAIVGPHGSGKTTLLAALANAVERAGRGVARVRVRGMADALHALKTIARLPSESMVCIDGWESLRWAMGPLVIRFARWRRVGLVVTSHVDRGIPVLARCATSPHLLAAIVAALPDHGGLIDGTDIDEAFWKHEGNVREALYDLYDRFERRIRCVSG